MRDLLNLNAILVIALIFVPLERLFPLRGDQAVLRKHWMNDAVYLFFNGIVIKAGFAVLVGALLVGIQAVVPADVGAAVRAQPVWLQAAEIILIADTGFYCAHRAFHAVPFLWRFHSIHHSIEEMDWLAAHRVHPVDQILTMTASLLPVYALGFSGSALAVYALIYQGQSILLHSNIRVGFGPLNWVLASPAFHRWHHANESEARDKNFAGQLRLLDLVAGTSYMPARMPAAYGTEEPVPLLYHQQLAYPFRARPQRIPVETKARETTGVQFS